MTYSLTPEVLPTIPSRICVVAELFALHFADFLIQGHLIGCAALKMRYMVSGYLWVVMNVSKKLQARFKSTNMPHSLFVPTASIAKLFKLISYGTVSQPLRACKTNT